MFTESDRVLETGEIPSKNIKDKIILINGTETTLGKAIAELLLRKGATVIGIQHQEDNRYNQVQMELHSERYYTIRTDILDLLLCQKAFENIFQSHKKIDTLINTATFNYKETEFQEDPFFQDLACFFYLTKAAVKHLRPGTIILNATSIINSPTQTTTTFQLKLEQALGTFTSSLASHLSGQNLNIAELVINQAEPALTEEDEFDLFTLLNFDSEIFAIEWMELEEDKFFLSSSLTAAF